MLKRVLQEIESSPGTLNINELSRKLDIDRSTLEGMIQHLVRTGRLVDDDASAEECGINGNCGSTCPGAASCIFFAKMPKTYSVPNPDGTRQV